MIKSHKIFLLFSFLLYGYIGSAERKPKQNIRYLIIGFFFRYAVSFFLILYFRNDLMVFIETPLFTLSQTILSVFSLLPIEKLRIDQGGHFFFAIPPLKYVLEYGGLTNAFCIILPAIFATSVSSFKEKIKILLLSIIYLSVLEIGFIIMDIYRWLISNYTNWTVKKGIDLYHLSIYPSWGADLIINCIAYLNSFHIVFILTIWGWIIYFFKNNNGRNLIEKFL